MAAPGAFGGSRGIAIDTVTALNGRTARLEVGGGAFGSNGVRTSSRMSVGYGLTGFASSSSSTPTFSTANSLSLPGLTGWEFEWLGNDRPVELIVGARRYDAGTNTYSDSVWALPVAVGGARTLTLDSSNLVANAAGSGPYSSIGFIVNGTITDAADFGVGKFSAVVPEPASMAVLGLGLAALKRRRRNG